ncbi:serine/threonine-protein kinase [Paraliomyxa miuraensis]|uniref:serine/threonine-protein kinase n=1 Tax=Paraliomyxa miuraensis TaxID=376150 RepID=UPI00225A2E57|nr:serine/threonine-protein kinase [Paraliomyxa miuraensis]MCX4246011.1 serine/threonine protein kinase [Paraliomyxa miuraensis]
MRKTNRTNDEGDGDVDSVRGEALAREFELRFQRSAGELTLGRYVVLGTLGAGGMGVVLRAYDRQLDRQVALKVLQRGLDEHHTIRLRREAQALARLSHPNVVQVYEVGELDGHTFVAMELVEGKTARAWAEQRPRPDWRACLRLYVQLGAGLAAAHEQGLVHRDFKPGNAIVDDKGRARVLDFGLARQDEQEHELEDTVTNELEPDHGRRQAVLTSSESITRTGSVLGTPAYMPHEQMVGRPADARSDQFSFCASLYEIQPCGSQPRVITRLLDETLGIPRGCSLVDGRRQSTLIDTVRAKFCSAGRAQPTLATRPPEASHRNATPTRRNGRARGAAGGPVGIEPCSLAPRLGEPVCAPGGLLPRWSAHALGGAVDSRRAGSGYDGTRRVERRRPDVLDKRNETESSIGPSIGDGLCLDASSLAFGLQPLLPEHPYHTYGSHIWVPHMGPTYGSHIWVTRSTTKNPGKMSSPFFVAPFELISSPMHGTRDSSIKIGTRSSSVWCEVRITRMVTMSESYHGKASRQAAASVGYRDQSGTRTDEEGQEQGQPTPG